MKPVKNVTDELSLPQQNYVEAIAELIDDHGHAHPARIADRLKVRKPSVTEAVDRLVEIGIVRREDQKVLFTEKGAGIASELSGRHATLRSFMVEILGMEKEQADTAACRMEHSVGPRFIKKIRSLHEFLKKENNAGTMADWRKETGAAP